MAFGSAVISAKRLHIGKKWVPEKRGTVHEVSEGDLFPKIVGAEAPLQGHGALGDRGPGDLLTGAIPELDFQYNEL
jgi:hypothetical protein